jgi:hypothetical protein
VNIRTRPFAACAIASACLLTACSPAASGHNAAAGVVPPAQENRLPVAGGASTTGHLFVATLPYFNYSFRMERFPLVDGKPATSPDLVFPNSAAPLAVAADGTVYAQDGTAFAIDVFPPGSTTPERQLMLNPCGPSFLYAGISAMTVDSDGYLYVSVVEGISGIKPDSRGCQSDTVVIYPPGAGGNTPPVRFIGGNGGSSAPPIGLAIGGTGALAITRSGNNDVLVFAHPLAHRQLLTQLFWDRVSDPEGIVYDTTEHEIFLANSYHTSLAVYSAHAQGSARPKRIIWNPGKHEYCGSIALRGNHVFVPDDMTSSVYEYDKGAHGTPPPIATLSLPFAPCGVATGP